MLTREKLEQLPLIETHISKVFLDQGEVFKLKKAVNFGFLDFSTLELREQACRAEVLLNRRLAPEIYLGVLPVLRDSGDQGESEIEDWVVHMKRLPDESRADRLLEAGRLGVADIDLVARVLANFHRDALCNRRTARFGSLQVIERNVVENFDQIESALREVLSRDQAREIEEWQLRFLADHESLFRRRAQEGRVRDCHGDLRLEHIYLSESGSGVAPSIIDCIEFNERFRYSDVCSDLAFLGMDLAWHDAPLLAERLLAAYALHSNDYELYSLVDFYESYRAFVRGKIATLTAQDSGIDARQRARAKEEARRYFLLALATERRSLQAPMVVAVGGVIASGKSTLARAVALELGGPVVSADPTRKFLIGVAPEEPVRDAAFTGAYSAEISQKTYQEVLRRARLVVRSGRPVVLDASFRSSELRRMAGLLAEQEGVPFHFVECQAPRDVIEGRLLERAKRDAVSDGRLEILDRFLASYQPARELAEGTLTRIDTTIPLAETLADLVEKLRILPHGLP